MKRPRTIVLLTLVTVGCGTSDEPSEAPPQAPSQTVTTPTRPPPFPPASDFRIGGAVTVRQAGAGDPTQCDRLYLRDNLVAIVRTFSHAGTQAIAIRCIGDEWASASAPTLGELESVGDVLDGYVNNEYEALVPASDGSTTFTPLEFAGRSSDISLSGRWVAYVSARNERDAAGGGREADAVGVIFDLGAKMVFQEALLGTCALAGDSGALSLAAPEWSRDGDRVVFTGDPDRCAFDAVSVTPE